MNSRATFFPPVSHLPFSLREAAARWFIRAGFLLLLAQTPALPAVVAAAQAQTVVKLDGKNVFIPEIKINTQANKQMPAIPLDTFLHIGSWKTTARILGDSTPLCEIDKQNKMIRIASPDKLLPNSKAMVVTPGNLNAFLNSIQWSNRVISHFAVMVTSDKPRPAVLELCTDAYAAVTNNADDPSHVTASNAIDSGGRASLPLMLDEGENVILVKLYSRGEPAIQALLHLDRSLDLQAAWQSQGGLLKKLVFASRGRDGIPDLDWSPHLGNFSVALEVRNVATNDIVFRRQSARCGKLKVEAGVPTALPGNPPPENGSTGGFALPPDTGLPPGIYEITYRARNDSASEFFLVGNPQEYFAELQERLSHHNPDSESRLNIEAQLRRARILLAKNNYNLFDRQWQEKAVYTLGSLTTFERLLKEGATNITKNRPGLHIRAFASEVDNSTQSYRLFVPSTYKPDVPMPLLVIVPTSIANTRRPAIEGPVMANQREAYLWAKHAEKHGYALLWPGYRSNPKGYTYESMRVNAAIQEVTRTYNVDQQRISAYATCGAGYNAGRMISEFENKFAAIVYDRAVFDFTPDELENPSPSIIEWLKAASPVPHVLANRNLKILVMHDDSKPAGHGPLKLTTEFLVQAEKTRDDIVTDLRKQPMTEASRMDRIFSWLSTCKNNNPNTTRSRYLEKAGYTGPIMEIFTTPVMIVKGTRALEHGQKIMQDIAESIREEYKNHFHGAECAIKADKDVTEDDIKNHSLILIGNPVYNRVWEKLHPRLPLKVVLDKLLYKDKTLVANQMFATIARHPDAPDKYVLLVGTGDTKFLQPVATSSLFNAWYDCYVFDPPYRIISKLDQHAARANE